MEISTKTRPPKLREVIQVPKKVSSGLNLVRFATYCVEILCFCLIRFCVFSNLECGGRA
jgi:hypothetical protein